jgi:hypothetical protein
MTPFEEHENRLAEWDKENLRSLLKTEYGKGFIWRLMEKCFVFSEPGVFDSSNATFHNLGRQSVGKQILTQILDINPDAYTELAKIGKREAKWAAQALETEKKYKEQKGEDND